MPVMIGAEVAMTEGDDTGSISDPTLKRALALVLIREVVPMLEDLDETVACAHLRQAIDVLVKPAGQGLPEGSC